MSVAALAASLCGVAAAPAAAAPVEFIAPGLDAPVSGGVNFGLSTAKGVDRAAFYVDGKLRDTDTSGPFHYGKAGVLDTERLDNGRHRLTVKFKTDDGRIKKASSVMKVRNVGGKGGARAAAADTTLPSVYFKSPTNGQRVSGVRQWSTCEAIASDNVGVARVQFYADSTPIGDEYGAPFNCNFDTRKFSEGAHVLKAVATDRSGNKRESSINVVVDNVAEAPKIAAPVLAASTYQAGAKVTAKATVTADRATTIKNATLTWRPKGRTAYAAGDNFTGAVSNVNLAAGQTITVSGENTLPTTAGEYDVFLAVETDQWRNSASTTLISTAPVATPTPTPAPDTSGTTNPTPAPSTGGLNDGTSYYVDSVAGNDANSGTSPSAAWKSTAKASSAALASGSNLLFKRGGSWTGTLTIAENGIAVGAYGTGDRPKFSAGNTGGCVLVTGNDNKVFDLYIDRCGVRDGIKVNGDRNLFERNYVTHNAAGVEIPGGADSNRFYRNELIANNVMTKNTCGGDDDYGAYSFANEGGTNTDIGWNVIRDAKASSCDYGVDGSALEIYRGSANFHHNVVSGNPAAAEMSGVAWAKIEYNVIHDGEIILQTSTKFAGANTNVRVAYNTTNERILGWVGANANGALYATKNLYTQGLWSGTTGFITNVDNKQIARSALDANLKPLAGSLAYGAYAPGGMNG